MEKLILNLGLMRIQQVSILKTCKLLKGCDSIVNLSLIVNPIYNDTIIAEICTNETYTLNGFNESNAGILYSKLTNYKGL